MFLKAKICPQTTSLKYVFIIFFERNQMLKYTFLYVFITKIKNKKEDLKKKSTKIWIKAVQFKGLVVKVSFIKI